MKRLTRRQMLMASLGASQVALLSSYGFLDKTAFAAADSKPTRLLTIYVDGGWMPTYAFCPLSNEKILERLPNPGTASGEPTFFTPDQVTNLDGSGNAMDPQDSSFQRLRVPHLWDEASLSAGNGDPRSGTSPHLWAYKEYGLHENLSVVHGVDMRTAAHESALISAMCGAAGSSYRAPAIHSVVGSRLFERFQNSRPLPVVAIGGGSVPIPVPLGLSANGSPTILPQLDALKYSLSERPNLAWNGFRDRAEKSIPNFDGMNKNMKVNKLEEYILKRTRKRVGTNAPTDAFVRSMFEMYGGVSNQLADDVITAVEKQNGWENLPHPHWINGSWTPYGMMHGRGISSDAGSRYAGVFNLALKLMKADVTSAISIGLRGLSRFRFDNHGDGHPAQFLHNRSLLDNIGRFLGEMKATMIGPDKSLLDDTMVLVFSEFGRTWPSSNTCDHWPITGTLFAGGGVVPNRMIGNYDFEGIPLKGTGPNGAAISILDEGENTPKMRPPTSADVVTTALHGLGIENHFIPGGTGIIQGVVKE